MLESSNAQQQAMNPSIAFQIFDCRKQWIQYQIKKICAALRRLYRKAATRAQFIAVINVTRWSSSHAVQIETHKQHFHALVYTLGFCCSMHNHTIRQHNKDPSKQITKASSLLPRQQERSRQVHLLPLSDVHPPKITIKLGRKFDWTKEELA